MGTWGVTRRVVTRSVDYVAAKPLAVTAVASVPPPTNPVQKPGASMGSSSCMPGSSFYISLFMSPPLHQLERSPTHRRVTDEYRYGSIGTVLSLWECLSVLRSARQRYGGEQIIRREPVQHRKAGAPSTHGTMHDARALLGTRQ